MVDFILLANGMTQFVGPYSVLDSYSGIIVILINTARRSWESRTNDPSAVLHKTQFSSKTNTFQMIPSSLQLTQQLSSSPRNGHTKLSPLLLKLLPHPLGNLRGQTDPTTFLFPPQRPYQTVPSSSQAPSSSPRESP